MTNDQKKMLTEFIGECWHDSVYTDHRGNICLKCDEATFLGDQRTFLTWQDLGDVKDALVREGLWVRFEQYAQDEWSDHLFHGGKESYFIPWLFRPIDEKGNIHFWRLVAEFLEARK